MGDALEVIDVYSEKTLLSIKKSERNLVIKRFKMTKDFLIVLEAFNPEKNLLKYIAIDLLTGHSQVILDYIEIFPEGPTFYPFIDETKINGEVI